MGYLLNVVYLLTIVAAFPWLLYQRLRHGKYCEGWRQKFLGKVPLREGDRPCLWLHAVSVGEVNLLDPIIKRWRATHPDWDIVISTTTQTGFALAQKKYSVPPLTTHQTPATVIYCPLDFTWAVRRAMERIRPTLFVLTELELWPNLVVAAKQYGAKIAVINGRLGEKSFHGYNWIRPVVHRVLSSLNLLAVQNEDYALRFQALGARARFIRCTGSIKFDGARTSRQNHQTQRLANLAGLQADDVVFLAGSTQDPEEAVALSVFRCLAEEFPRLKLIVVPRHPERFDEVSRLLDQSGLAWQRRSQLSAVNCQPTTGYGPTDIGPSPRILLIDTIGELGAWWGTAHIAFVGGSFTNRGGQNMIEPAAYGAAVSFGPNTWNFRDVVAQMLERDAAVVVRDAQELEAFLRRCLIEPQFAATLGRRAQQLVLEQQGAADRTIELLNQLVGNRAVTHAIEAKRHAA